MGKTHVCFLCDTFIVQSENKISCMLQLSYTGMKNELKTVSITLNKQRNYLPYTSISQISSIAPVVASSSGASYVVSTMTYLAVCIQGMSIIFFGNDG